MCNILSNLIYSFLRNRRSACQQQERVVPLKTGQLQILEIMLCYVALCGKTQTLSRSVRPTSCTHNYIMHFSWRQTCWQYRTKDFQNSSWKNTRHRSFLCSLSSTLYAAKAFFLSKSSLPSYAPFISNPSSSNNF